MSGKIQLRPCFVLAGSLLVFAGPASADEIRNRVGECAAKPGDSERLACFDTLASDLDKMPDASPVAVSANVSTPTGVPAPPAANTRADAAVEDKSDRDDPDPQQTRVTRCSLASSSSRQVYYLENGQIWRQSNRNRNILRDCNADVTIRKDLFGYQMDIASEDRSIRVTRVR